MTGGATLAQRLARALVLRMALVWALCVVAVAFYLNHEIEENFDAELAESAHRIIEVAMFQFDRTGPQSLPLEAQPPLFRDEPLVYQLVDAEGRLLLRSEAAPSAPFAVPLQQGLHSTPAWRVYVAKHPQRPLYFLLADAMSERNHEWRETLAVLLFGALIALVVLLVTLPAVATRELRVLGTLQRQIGERGAGDMRPLALDGLPAELHAVGEDVNRLLDRLGQALDVERALAANAAHELRTPLAVAQLRLQTAFDAGLDDEHVHAAHEALQRLRSRTEKLLQLSRAESGAALQQEPVQLDSLASTLAQEFWHSDDARRRLDLLLPDTPMPAVHADADTLAIALRNLVENALRYSAGAAVEIEVLTPATLVVRDAGPGVTPEQLTTLRERHVRHAHDQAGYGLGLSITTSIVARHGGTLELVSPVPGKTQGLEARIVLPTVATAKTLAM